MSHQIHEILQCPITGAELRPLDGPELSAIREAIRSGSMRHIGGGVAADSLAEMESALVTPDGIFVYPVIDGIHVLLPGLAVVTGDRDLAPESWGLAAETDAAMRFYDDIGWKADAVGHFEDAVRFEDLRPVTRDYAHQCHLRVGAQLPAGGKYLLDVASGPVQYPEYLTYSENFGQRICGDVSFAALKAARRKLGDRGIYLQCDITRLPIRTGSIPAFVSLHTIYHVPADRQILAFRELERVCADGGKGVVIYSWGRHSAPMRLTAFRWRPLRAIKRLVRKLVPTALVRWVKGAKEGAEPEGGTRREGLYFHAFDQRWFDEQVNCAGGWRVAVWRFVSVPFTKRYVHPWLFGGALLRLILHFEMRYPTWAGRNGQYPMLLFSKGTASGRQ